MITDYQSLSEAIRNYLDRTDLDDHIPLFVQQAEFEINRLRVRENEKVFEETMVDGEIELPEDFLAARELFLEADPTVNLKRAAPGQTMRLSQVPGRPKMYARSGNKLIFAPRPDADYTVRGIYYYRPAPLTQGPDTNWAIQYYPIWFLHECLAATAMFTRDDERLPAWKALAAEMKSQIERDSAREEFAGPMVMRRA